MAFVLAYKCNGCERNILIICKDVCGLRIFCYYAFPIKNVTLIFIFFQNFF